MDFNPIGYLRRCRNRMIEEHPNRPHAQYIIRADYNCKHSPNNHRHMCEAFLFDNFLFGDDYSCVQHQVEKLLKNATGREFSTPLQLDQFILTFGKKYNINIVRPKRKGQPHNYLYRGLTPNI